MIILTDKLGIKSIIKTSPITDSGFECSADFVDIIEVQNQRNEMLEVLIELHGKALESIERSATLGGGVPLSLMQMPLIIEKSIEKIDPQHRTWSKIKELI